jgi:hypothetical protein
MPAQRSFLGLIHRVAAITALGVLGSACSALGGHGTQPSSAVASGPARPGFATHQKILARAAISASAGGRISTAGVALTVPAHVLSKNGTAVIAETAPAIYDVSVNVPWQGRVAVTVPLSGPNDLVVHYIGGGWRVESTAFGRQTVWVTHLSPFSALSDLAKKAVCLKSMNPKSIVTCLLSKGVKSVSAGFASWLAHQLDLGDACTQQIIGSGGFLSAIYHAFSGACVGHAGESGFTIPPATGNGPASTSPRTPAPARAPAQSAPAQQPAGPVFAVMNTSETPPDGVWFRNSPHVNDTDRVTGHGVYAGEHVQLRCYGWGDSVGPYNNRLWYYVTNITRPTNNGVPNVGWLNAHYINDGQVANVVDNGVPAC